MTNPLSYSDVEKMLYKKNKCVLPVDTQVTDMDGDYSTNEQID